MPPRNIQIVAVSYSIEHDASVDYTKAKPLDHTAEDFRVHVANGVVRFEFLTPCSTTEEARKRVEPFIAAWELESAISQGIDRFRLRFSGEETVNKSPNQDVSILVAPYRLKLRGHAPSATTGHSDYPPPPNGLKVTPDVEIMAHRYTMYKQGKIALANMAYFCLTMLEGRFNRRDGKQRDQAAQWSRIDSSILKRIGDLTANTESKDRTGTGKRDGISADFSDPERHWLEEAVKTIIYRVAERDYDPNQTLSEITQNDLPALDQH